MLKSARTDAGDALEAKLLSTSLEAFERWGRSLGGALGEAWGTLYRTWTQGVDPQERAMKHFAGPLGSPAIPLLAGVWEGLFPGAACEGPADDAAEAMLCLYFAVRSQDDRVDEGARGTTVYLEHALQARALRLAGSVSGDPGALLSAWEGLSVAFCEAALDDDARRRDPAESWSPEAIERQGSKYLPMALPLVALFLRAGRADAVPLVGRAVAGLGVGLQLTNDLLGAEHDLATGQRTWLLALLGLHPGVDPPEALLPAVRRAARDGRLERYTTRISEALRGGLGPLDFLGGSRLADHVEARVSALEKLALRYSLRALAGVPRLVADVELTRRCNLRCPACFVFAQEASGTKPEELTTALVFELLEELSGYRTHLHLTGGEPFLHPGIWEVLARAEALGLEEVIVNTNATTLDDAALARLGALALPVHLLVSVDGPEALHDAARGRGTWARALGALRRARGLGLRATPATILTRELVEGGLGAWFEALKGELPGLDAVVLWPLFLGQGAARGDDRAGHEVEPEQLPAVAREVAAWRRAGWSVVVADHPVLNPWLQQEGVPEGELWQCGAGRDRLAVQADGVVTPCHPFRLELGRVAQGSAAGFVQRVLAHETWRALGRRAHPGCEGCDARSVCGSCQAAVVGRGGELFSRDERCARELDGRAPDPRRLTVVA